MSTIDNIDIDRHNVGILQDYLPHTPQERRALPYVNLDSSASDAGDSDPNADMMFSWFSPSARFHCVYSLDKMTTKVHVWSVIMYIILN